MKLLADTHVHLYPAFPLDSVFMHAVGNLAAGGDACAGIFLTERQGEHWFRHLRKGEVDLPPGLRTEPSEDGGALWLVSDDSQRLLLIPGRQLVSAERIEVLCLTRDVDLGDGIPAGELVEAIPAAGGVAVLPWSPGKWLGPRGKIVHGLIAAARPGTLLMGDIAMRPRFAPLPAPMRSAVTHGLRVLAGTDPLPLPGDESIIGRYGVSLTFDPQHPIRSLHAALTLPASTVTIVGRRSPVVQSLRRWTALRRRRA